MEYAGPVVRTFVQAAIPVLVAAGTNFVSVELWKVAALSGGAAVLSYVQRYVRDSA
jgi:hypothetical protein